MMVGTGCIVEAPTREGTQSNRHQPVPALRVNNGANFDGKVELVSVEVNPGRGVTGEPVRVSANFRVIEKIDRDYIIFVHVEDVDGRVDRLNVDHAPRARPTTQWNPGETIRDEFDIPIPPQMPVRGLNLALGFWDPKTDERLPLKNKDQVRNDGRDRVFVASFPVVQP
jgi:hypothetical protein